MSRCPLCRGGVERAVRAGLKFLNCAPCQLAWLSEEELGAQGGSLHFHRARSTRSCLSCRGEQFDRTVILTHGMVTASHCVACRTLTFPLPSLLGSFPRSRPARPALAAPGEPKPRKIAERDRVFAFLLALPLELSEQRDTVPFGVAALVGACTVAFVLDVLSDGVLGSALVFSNTDGYVGMAIGSLTSAFVHLDLFHLLGNMYFLYAFGRLLERRLTTGIVVHLFAGSAVTASLAFWVVHYGRRLRLQELLVLLRGFSAAISLCFRPEWSGSLCCCLSSRSRLSC